MFCPAGVCKNLFEYVIDAELCNGCTICKLKCPENQQTVPLTFSFSSAKSKPVQIPIEPSIEF